MSGIKQDVVVLSAMQYDMVNRETGEIVQGTTIRYALSDNLLPYEEGSLKGYKLAKTSLGYNDFVNFTEVPGIYTCNLMFNVSADGTTKIQATDFHFKKPLFAPVASASPKKAGD